MSDVLNRYCKRCGRTVRQLVFEAILKDLGAIIHPDPNLCEHELVDIERNTDDGGMRGVSLGLSDPGPVTRRGKGDTRGE